MNSEILNMIGFGNIDIAYFFMAFAVVILILLILVIIQIIQSKKMKKKLEMFMRGKDVKSMEEQILQLFEDNKSMKEDTSLNNKDIRKLCKMMNYSYQKLGIVKYDAFREIGGKLSFSMALVNGSNDGFVMNSVHSSDGCYCYTKEIQNGYCNIPLGEEEQKALNIAMNIKD